MGIGPVCWKHADSALFWLYADILVPKVRFSTLIYGVDVYDNSKNSFFDAITPVFTVYVLLVETITTLVALPEIVGIN
jgi:hypothetical protein